MVRPHLPIEPSPYYPPRARWYSRWLRLGQVLGRLSAWERLRLPQEMRAAQLAAGFLVPGLAVCFRGPRRWGRAALGVSAGLGLSFIVWLGYPAANLAFGTMVSIHATGFVYYCSPMLRDWTAGGRLGFTFLILLALWLALYLPAREFVQEHWLTPVRLDGRVVVVQKAFVSRRIHRGDWVAYDWQEHQTGDGHHGGAVWVREGLGVGPVLAVAGDQVTFSTNSFAVNGVARPRLPHMPASGGLILPANQWFIWPSLDISGHGNVSEEHLTAAMLNLAEVDQSQFYGKPLGHWFWRRQYAL